MQQYDGSIHLESLPRRGPGPRRHLTPLWYRSRPWPPRPTSFKPRRACETSSRRTWPSAAISNGLGDRPPSGTGSDEINGPTFEHLDLFTIKSGDAIVSELFSFQRSGGDTDYALRAEFTPTLARMAAAKGRSLPTPTKWFAIPDLFRAERPQKGRLREHRQWNVDILGVAGTGSRCGSDRGCSRRPSGTWTGAI